MPGIYTQVYFEFAPTPSNTMLCCLFLKPSPKSTGHCGKSPTGFDQRLNQACKLEILGIFLLELCFILYTQLNVNILHAYDYINLSNVNAKQVVAVIQGATGNISMNSSEEYFDFWKLLKLSGYFETNF